MNTLAAVAFIMLGQGGTVTSGGMYTLANQFRALGIETTVHSWDDHNRVIAAIQKLPAKTPIVMAGYSLGVGGVMRVTGALPKRRFALVAAYDPSIWDHMFLNRVPTITSNVTRVLLYRNACPDFWGHAKIAGKQVETTEICTLHLTVPLMPALHAKTTTAVKWILK